MWMTFSQRDGSLAEDRDSVYLASREEEHMREDGRADEACRTGENEMHLGYVV